MFNRTQLQRNADTATAGGTTTLLAKGERVALIGKDGNALTKAYIGAGWDLNRVPSGQTYDLDLFAFLLGKNKKVYDPADLHKTVAYYANKTLLNGAVQCGPDNLSGVGDGDDENCIVDLAALPADVEEVVFGMNIYNSESKGHQHFGNVDGAFVRVCDQANMDASAELKKFNLTEDFSAFNGILCGAFYRADNGWKFRAIGEGCNGSIQQISETFK